MILPQRTVAKMTNKCHGKVGGHFLNPQRQVIMDHSKTSSVQDLVPPTSGDELHLPTHAHNDQQYLFSYLHLVPLLFLILYFYTVISQNGHYHQK